MKFRFSDHVLKEGHEIKTIGETVIIMHIENRTAKEIRLEEIEILKATSSSNDINDRNDPKYKLLPSNRAYNLNDDQPS